MDHIWQFLASDSVHDRGTLWNSLRVTWITVITVLASSYTSLSTLDLQGMLMWMFERVCAGMENGTVSLNFVEYILGGYGNLSRGLIQKGFNGCELGVLCNELHGCPWVEIVWLGFGTKCPSWVAICVAVKGIRETTSFFNTARDFVVGNIRLMLIILYT